MSQINEAIIPVIYHGNEKWLLLNFLSNTGKLRAVSISKPRQVHDPDSHHCNEVSVKSSIRYFPKKWAPD